jgi:hypothetical protein
MNKALQKPQHLLQTWVGHGRRRENEWGNRARQLHHWWWKFQEGEQKKVRDV